MLVVWWPLLMVASNKRVSLLFLDLSDSMLYCMSNPSPGRQQPLPAWTQSGVIIGLEGGTQNVSAHVDALIAGNVQIAGIWLQDWVGIRSDTDGDRLIWNWELNEEHYPNWSGMTGNWSAAGIRVLTYLNPFFSDPSSFSYVRNYYQEGIEQGYFVRNSEGAVYLMQSLTITFATLDLTNTAAREWMKAIIINNTLSIAGSSGWMADFGEYLPYDAILDGGSGNEFHNQYPQLWGELVAEAVDEFRIGHPDREVLWFMRSAWISSSKSVPCYWLGDQLQAFDEDDGMASLISAAVSSGLVGHALTHSDIGGYNMIAAGPGQEIEYIRNAELLKRWTEMGAFGFALMRTHIGSSMSSAVAQVYDCPNNIKHFAEFSHIFGNLSAYRGHLMEDASKYGHPMLR